MGSGGWAELHGDDLALPGRVYARFTRVGERFRVSELYIDGQGEPIQAGALRQFPIGMIEDWLSREDWLAATEGSVGIDLSRLATSFAESRHGASAGYKGRVCECCGAPLRGSERWRDARAKLASQQGREFREQPITDWVELSMLAQLTTHYEQAGLPPVPQAADPSPRRRSTAEPEPIQLAYPVDGLTDAFLSDVARAYRAAVGQGRTDPAVAIAEAMGETSNVRTVHSWIYKARKQGFLPPARKDRRG